jgi:hypothetical protein
MGLDFLQRPIIGFITPGVGVGRGEITIKATAAGIPRALALAPA